MTRQYFTSIYAFLISTSASWLFIPNKAMAVNTDPDAAIGPVLAPPGVDKVISNSGAGRDDIAILFFISNLVVLLTVIAGLWSTINVILAGYTYITNNGKADSHEKVKNQIMMSVIGLIFILTAYTFAGILGIVLFGDASIFLKPVINSI